MSQKNVESISALYDHFNHTGEPDWDRFDPEAEFDPSDVVGLPRVRLAEGKEKMRGLLRDYAAAFDDWRIEPKQLIDAGDRVVAVVRDGGHVKGSGDEIFNDFTHVWTFRSGKVVHWKTFTDHARALEAAGLER